MEAFGAVSRSAAAARGRVLLPPRATVARVVGGKVTQACRQAAMVRVAQEDRLPSFFSLPRAGSRRRVVRVVRAQPVQGHPFGAGDALTDAVR